MKKKQGIRKTSSKKKVAAKVGKKKTAGAKSPENKKKVIAQKKVVPHVDEFPGYPHYPSTDDITNPRKGYEKMELNESLRRLGKPKGKPASVKPESEQMEKPWLPDLETSEEEFAASNVSADEKRLLESDELSEDMGEDEELRTRVWDVDVSGSDLDIPGAESDDEEEDVGEEDEENNLYSLGGDRHEDMEQSHDPGR
jgi:hypothetical protein